MNTSPSLLLIVNDDPDQNYKMECVLWLNGYDAESAQSLADARVRIHRKRYALMLCRNMMPDGFCLELVREAWNVFALPLLALIADVPGWTREQKDAARVPPDCIRGKLYVPFNQQQLLMGVAKATGREDVGPAYRNFDPATKPKPCPECHGTGQVNLLVHRKPCLACAGRGEIPRKLGELPIRHLSGLPAEVRFSLHRAGIETLAAAAELTDDELKQCSGLSDVEVALVKVMTAKL